MTFPTWRILTGDCRSLLRTLEAGSVQTCVTSPPYFGLRDYGTDGQLGLEATPDEYVAGLVDVFREVRRVLRDDGTVWLNLGDSYNSTPPGNKNPMSKSGLNGAQTSAKYRERLKETQQRQQEGRSLVAGCKPKDLLGVPWMVAFALRADGWYLRSDIIWCLSGGARVYARTRKGDMPMSVKDLVRLHPATVKLWDGEKWTQALGWHRSTDHGNSALEIELRSGERIGCTAGHEWPTQRGNVRADNLQPGDVVQTCRLPRPDDILAPAHVSDSVAWLAGLYLAEGSTDSRGSIQLAGHARESLNRLGRLDGCVRAFGGTLRQHGSGDSHSIVIDCPPLTAIVKQYIHGTTARTKGIKVRAWRHDDSWLRALLDGYLSGDGHYDEKNARWRLGFTRNDRLAADMRTLAARLGYTLTLKAGFAEGFGQRWPAYRGELRYEASEHHNAKNRGEVIAIRRSRGRGFWDIGVEDEPHTFALASGVLTHNSKPNPMPESVTDRPTKAHEYVFLLSKQPRYVYDADAIREEAEPSGWANSRAAGVDTWEYGKAAGGTGVNNTNGVGGTSGPGGRNKRSVWTVATQPYPGAHFATFPPKLIEPCILAGCPERACQVCGAPWERIVEVEHVERENGGRSVRRADLEESRLSAPSMMRTNAVPQSRTLGFRPSCGHDAPTIPGVVLDPFAGAGTTGLVALRHNRSFIGIELNPAYATLARDRIIDDSPLLNTHAEMMP